MWALSAYRCCVKSQDSPASPRQKKKQPRLIPGQHPHQQAREKEPHLLFIEHQIVKEAASQDRIRNYEWIQIWDTINKTIV